jgi:hypothetical protein
MKSDLALDITDKEQITLPRSLRGLPDRQVYMTVGYQDETDVGSFTYCA